MYGQGNFLFDHSESEFWQTSVFVRVNLSDGSIDYIPIFKEGNSVKLACDLKKNEILSTFNNRTLQIKERGFIENQYAEFSKTMISGYLNRSDSLTSTFVFRVMNRLLGNRLASKISRNKIRRHRMALINQYKCEAHRELILKGLEVSSE